MKPFDLEAAKRGEPIVTRDGLIKCVVPVSGGKDSQSCIKLAVETFGSEQVIGLFCDTQFEHPLTYEHIDRISSLYNVKIERVSDGNVQDRCLRYGRFPSGIARFCTDDLKMKPSKRFYENLAARQGAGFQVWYGMRTGESTQRARKYKDCNDFDLYPAHDLFPGKYPKHLETMGVMFRLPVVDWTTSEIVEFVGQSNLNHLYLQGFDRVGCFPCLAAGDKYKKKAFSNDDTGKKHYAIVRMIEDRINKSVFTSANSEDICPICQE